MPRKIDIFGSSGVQSVLARMCPDNAPSGTRKIPAGLLSADLRVSGSESVHQWFSRIIGTTDVAQNISRVAVNPNFAFCGEIRWENQQINYCQFQALITSPYTLDEFYNRKTETAFYYRFDIDFNALGKLFSHPHPHIHSVPQDAPRFPFVQRSDEFILVTFLEFIFLNHFHDDWLKWAEANAATHITEENFAEIVFGFEGENTIQFGQAKQANINDLKTALRIAKCRAVDAIPISPLCGVFTY